MEKELLDVTKKSGIVFFGGLTANLLSLVFNLLVARFVGAKIYGQFTYIFTFVSFLPAIGALGFNSGLVYSIPKLVNNGKLKERNSLIGFCFLSVACLSTLLALGVFWKSNLIASLLLNKRELADLLKVLAPLSVILAFTPVMNGLFTGTGHIKEYVLVQNIILPAVKTVTVLVLALLGFKLWGLVAATYIATACGLLILIWNIKSLGLFARVSWKYRIEYKKLLVFSFPLMLAAILIFINNRINTLMIGYYLPAQQVGIYNIAWRVGWTSVFILNVFTSMFAPMISTLYHRGEIQKLGQLFKTITKWIVAGNLIVLAIVLLFSVEIMRIFGKEFINGSTALIIITIGQVANAGTGSAGTINTMTGHSMYELYCNLLILILGAGLNYFLIPVYGISGAAVTSLITIGTINIIRLILVYRDHHIHPYSWSYFKVIGSCALSYFFIWGLKSLIHLNWFLGLIVFSCLYVVLFIIFNLILGLSDDDRLIINKVIAKLKRAS